MLFIGGLHRSGTTPLARWIARHPKVSAFRNTGVFEDEGQHLQDVYATAAQHGGPGRFAFDDAAHLTEASKLVSEDSRKRLWSSWSPHWDLSKSVLLEKSPPNLVRTRFLQALFPGRSRFLVVLRHPIAVAYATKGWSRSFDLVPVRAARRLAVLQAPVHSLLRHWVVAHEQFLSDAPSLGHVRIVRYEDLVADTTTELARIFAFLGLEPVQERWEVKTALNERYIRRWERLHATPIGRSYLRRMEHEFEDRMKSFGYSLSRPRQISPPAPHVRRYLTGDPAARGSAGS